MAGVSSVRLDLASEDKLSASDRAGLRLRNTAM